MGSSYWHRDLRSYTWMVRASRSLALLQPCMYRISHQNRIILGLRPSKLYHRTCSALIYPLHSSFAFYWIRPIYHFRSQDTIPMSISLFYFANCPLLHETNGLLCTADALEHCANLQLIFAEYERFKLVNNSDLSRAVSHIHNCLVKRVEFVQQSCKDLAPSAIPHFDGIPFDVANVIEVVRELGVTAQARNSASYRDFDQHLCSYLFVFRLPWSHAD